MFTLFHFYRAYDGVTKSYQDPVSVGLVNKNRNLNTTFIWVEWLDSQRLNPHIVFVTECRSIITGQQAYGATTTDNYRQRRRIGPGTPCNWR